mmetsp:Transcript_1236/g.1737  ORF Transcript_1236/g.1737 Transcript_1236/m.1737 type:complete len:136 (+) Transcript_1236:171-578(+)|eukprot:CAMPEP_0117891482 /NCGR_PEP_ID=MMETSP0950-20121206/23994_1 /TAXON_ID=44440 /ORGANISM="Chattonella subsalsa, Strain CCMP2191" /LENGTH=135 /DNA_ID=CAMNT_0005751033 /DNA_START=107 /DNA_END=514 /DNA_ORIENTATION=+
MFQITKSLITSPSRIQNGFIGASRTCFRYFSVQQVPSLEAFQKLQNSEGKSVVYFTAKWCGPCRRMGPIFEEVSDATKNIEFAKVDVDENSEAANLIGIKSVPTFLFYFNGEEVSSFSGADVALLKERIEDLQNA